MTWTTSPHTRPLPPARALRKCAKCGGLTVDAVQDGGTWVCPAVACAPKETPLTRFTTPRCDKCGTEVDVHLVEVIEQGTGPGGGRYACAACSPPGQAPSHEDHTQDTK